MKDITTVCAPQEAAVMEAPDTPFLASPYLRHAPSYSQVSPCAATPATAGLDLSSTYAYSSRLSPRSAAHSPSMTFALSPSAAAAPSSYSLPGTPGHYSTTRENNNSSSGTPGQYSTTRDNNNSRSSTPGHYNTTRDNNNSSSSSNHNSMHPNSFMPSPPASTSTSNRGHFNSSPVNSSHHPYSPSASSYSPVGSGYSPLNSYSTTSRGAYSPQHQQQQQQQQHPQRTTFSPVTIKTEPPSSPLMSSLSSPSSLSHSPTPSPSSGAVERIPPPLLLAAPRAGGLGAKRSLSPMSSGVGRGSSSASSSSAGMRIKKERPASPGMTVSGNLLPPCRICLDKASGFHYGLNTCEACKGFFRRSLKRGASYVCTREGKCDVTGERRNLCGYCRYHKCVSLGMSKTAIKTGRYTHAKRTRDTLEIKKMQGADSSLEEEEETDLDSVISHIIHYHDKHVICCTKKPKSFIDEQLKKKMDETLIQKDLFGETGVSTDQHQEFMALTGMDLDNREAVMNFHVSNSDRWIRGFIEFAKNVPGFKDLTLGDQARLIKYARIEFWFLGSYQGYHPELGLAVMPNGRCFTRKEMYTVWKEKYIDVSFELSQTIKKLQVTPDEMILVKAICLTAEDRCPFDEPKQVEQLQWRLVRCLQHLLRQRLTKHSEFVSTFSQVITCLTGLRDLNEAECQTIQNTQLYEKFSKNDLMMEVLPY